MTMATYFKIPKVKKQWVNLTRVQGWHHHFGHVCKRTSWEWREHSGAILGQTNVCFGNEKCPNYTISLNFFPNLSEKKKRYIFYTLYSLLQAGLRYG